METIGTNVAALVELSANTDTHLLVNHALLTLEKAISYL